MEAPVCFSLSIKSWVFFLGTCRALVEELYFQKQPEGVGGIHLVGTVVFQIQRCFLMSASKSVPSFIHQQTRLPVNKQAVVSSNHSAISSGKHKINHMPGFFACGLPFLNVKNYPPLLCNLLLHHLTGSEIFTIGKGCNSIQTNNEILLYLLQENF